VVVVGIKSLVIDAEYPHLHTQRNCLDDDRCSTPGCRLAALASWFRSYPFRPTATARSDMSDSGSGMGAAGCCQLRSEAVTVPGWMPLTCGNVVQQWVCQVGAQFASRGSGVQIPSAPRKPAGQRVDMWSCRLTLVRFARFWERQCPILGADLEAAPAASRNCLTGHGVKDSGAGCPLPSEGRSFAQRSRRLSDISFTDCAAQIPPAPPPDGSSSGPLSLADGDGRQRRRLE